MILNGMRVSKPRARTNLFKFYQVFGRFPGFVSDKLETSETQLGNLNEKITTEEKAVSETNAKKVVR